MATSLPKRTIPRFVLTHKLPITVLRYGAGEWVMGRWVPAPVTEIPLEANVQPMKGIDLMVLPESDRTTESIKVYTVETLRTVEEVGQADADIIVWQGKKFKAVKAMTYQMGVLDHTKTICCRLPATPNDKATADGTP